MFQEASYDNCHFNIINGIVFIGKSLASLHRNNTCQKNKNTRNLCIAHHEVMDCIINA